MQDGRALERVNIIR